MSRRSGSLKPLRSFLKTSLPAAIDLASQTIMWTIEAILIGKLGGAALAGHSMAIQIVLVFFAVLITFVVGAGLIINRHIGARDFKSANHILGQSLMLAVIMAALFSIVWHFGGVQLLRLIRENGSDSAQAAGMSYLRMVSFFGPLIMTNFVAVGIIRAVGETRFSMRINLTTNVVNLLLAPIFIFGLFGAPRLEVRGAALAVGCAHT
ncbi:MAG: MATE family efflux transporter, partial [candidate division KSB1 bacterium]|nr:MATE family efflux transporter [candidate division KSB1 bacterium]